jgi:hypothetical protein
MAEIHTNVSEGHYTSIFIDVIRLLDYMIQKKTTTVFTKLIMQQISHSRLNFNAAESYVRI